MYYYYSLSQKNLNVSFLAQPVLNVRSSVTKSIYREPYTLMCRASFNPKIATQLIQYLVLEWTGPDGVSLSIENGVIIEQQQTNRSEATRSLTFHPLNMTHSGTYQCKASVLLPDSENLFISTSQFHLNVLSKSTFL